MTKILGVSLIALVTAVTMKRDGVYVPPGTPFSVADEKTAQSLIDARTATRAKQAAESDADEGMIPGRLVAPAARSAPEKPKKPADAAVLNEQIVGAALALNSETMPSVRALAKELGYAITAVERDEALKDLYPAA